jgi:hypothetical protein
MLKVKQKKVLAMLMTLAMVISLIPAMTQPAKAAAGDTWTNQTAANSGATAGNVLTSVCYGGSTYVAVGQNGTIVTSSNGVTWTSRTSGTTCFFSDVCTNGSGTFVAIAGGNMSSDGAIVTSTNSGVTWSSQPFNGYYASVCYGNGMFMAFADGDCYTSLNGIDWTEKCYVDTYSVYGLSYQNIGGTDTYVGVGYPDDVSDPYGNYVLHIISSTDSGTTWSKDISFNGTENLNAVCYGGSNFVAVGDGGLVLTSNTGLTNSWTRQAAVPNNNFQDVCYTGVNYIAVGYDGSYNPVICSSTNGGVSWTSRTPNTTNELRGVCYGNNMLVAVGVGGTIITSGGNATPTVTTSGGNAAYTEQQAAASVIDSGISISDPDGDTDWAGGKLKVQITENNLASDMLSLPTTNGGAIWLDTNGNKLMSNATQIGTADAGSVTNGTSWTLTFDGNATSALVASTAKAIEFSNSSDDPGASRIVTFTAIDNKNGTASNTKTISITAINDPPTLTVTRLDPTFTENGAAVALFSGAAVSTVESGQTISGLSLTVGNLTDGASEILRIDGEDVALTNGNSVTTTTNGMTCSVSVTGSTATVTISKTGGISAQNMQTLVNGITYRNLSENPTTSSDRVITLISIKDNGGTANGGVDISSLALASAVTVAAVSDAPVLTAGGGAASYTENGAPIVIDGSITASDVDNNTLSSATVSITANFQSGKDELALVGAFGNIMASYDADTGVLTVTCNNPKELTEYWQAALRAVTFSSTSENPGTSRTISFVVNDGSVDSTPATKNIAITPVNDAPTMTAPESISVTEDVAAALTGVSFTDVDAGNASVTVTLSVPSGTLAASSSAGVTVGGTQSDITLTGSIANINAFIASSNVSYTTGANVTAEVTLGISINDGGNTGSGGALTASTTVTLTVTAINDAPTITAPGSISVIEDSASALTGISIADADAGSASVTVTLSVPSGTLAATSGSGVTVGGTASAITLTGSIADINAFIAASNVTFTTALNATSSVTLTVSINDGGNTGSGGAQTTSTTVILMVAAVNDAPTDIALSSASISESVGIGTAVFDLSTTDPDTADAFTYTLVSGVGSDDNASFTIDSGSLKTATTFSYATKNSYSIRVKTTDAGGLTFEKAFTINITEVNHAPTDIALSTTSIDENLATNSTVGALSTTDANASDTFTYTLVSGDGSTDNASFNILGNVVRYKAQEQ